MKAICDIAAGTVLFCQAEPDDQPAGRVVLPLVPALATYALKGFPLVWDGGTGISIDLAPIKAELSARVKELRDEAEVNGCTVPGIGTFDTAGNSNLKILGAVVTSSIMGPSFTIDWRLADNSIVTLTAAQMALVGLTVSNHVNLCQARKNALDQAIADAETIAELEAIDIHAGWPA